MLTDASRAPCVFEKRTQVAVQAQSVYDGLFGEDNGDRRGCLWAGELPQR
jgi:hypothetical protein